MRFLIGLLLGFAIGFAAAILFAPERTKRGEAIWAEGGQPLGPEPERAGANGSTGVVDGFQKMARSLREHLNEAWAEAKQASDEAEREMRGRYEQATGRKAGSRR